LLALDVDDHLFDQAADQLFAVSVGGCWRGPDAAEVDAERQQLLALGVSERARSLLLAQDELGSPQNTSCGLTDPDPLNDSKQAGLFRWPYRNRTYNLGIKSSFLAGPIALETGRFAQLITVG
jgi:hypothetical protein